MKIERYINKQKMGDTSINKMKRPYPGLGGTEWASAWPRLRMDPGKSWERVAPPRSPLDRRRRWHGPGRPGGGGNVANVPRTFFELVGWASRPLGLMRRADHPFITRRWYHLQASTTLAIGRLLSVLVEYANGARSFVNHDICKTKQTN